MPLAWRCTMRCRPLVLLVAGAILGFTSLIGIHAEANTGRAGGPPGVGDRPSIAFESPTGPMERPVSKVPLEPANHPATERRWYGYQTLLADTGALLLLIGVPSANHNVDDIVGGAVYAGGAPLVHLMHRRPWAALASLGMRSGALLVAVAASRGTDKCETTCKTAVGSCADDPNGQYWHTTSTSCQNSDALFGVLGIVLVSAIDSILARAPVSPPAESPPPAAPPLRRPTIDSIGLIPSQSGAAISLAGHF